MHLYISSSLPVTQKHAIVYPRLKKQTLDADDPCTFRPISNLSFISKLVERMVTSRFVLHSENNKTFPASQSAYRQFHSTETAVCIVHNDLVRAIDRGQVTALVMLDLSAAFNTVDHEVLLEILTHRFSVGGVALEWFNSYLSDRTQTFCSLIRNLTRTILCVQFHKAQFLDRSNTSLTLRT